MKREGYWCVLLSRCASEHATRRAKWHVPVAFIRRDGYQRTSGTNLSITMGVHPTDGPIVGRPIE